MDFFFEHVIFPKKSDIYVVSDPPKFDLLLSILTVSALAGVCKTERNRGRGRRGGAELLQWSHRSRQMYWKGKWPFSQEEDRELGSRYPPNLGSMEPPSPSWVAASKSLTPPCQASVPKEFRSFSFMFPTSVWFTRKSPFFFFFYDVLISFLVNRN